MKATSPSRIVLSLALLTVLTGCAFAPEPTVDRSAPAQWTQQPTDRTDRAGEPTPGAKLTVADLQTWWSRWNDAELNALVDQALAQNLDLAQALGRLKQQRLMMGVASAAYQPEVSGGIRTLQDVAAVDSYFHASIDVAWDLGLFGAREASQRTAHSELLNVQASVRAASVALVADVVHRYLDIRMAQYQYGLFAERVALDERTVQLLKVRREQRLDTTEAVHQATLQLTQSRAQFIALKESQTRAAHALAVLLGRSQPDPKWLADGNVQRPSQHPALDLQVLPADLLRTRPDIQTAEAAVERAAGALGLSRSALYPRFALSGSLLFSYNLTQNRRTTADHMPLVGPVIDIPLFDWGRRRSQADADEAALDVAIMGYRQSVLEGIADVETALAGLNAQRKRLDLLQSTQTLIAERDAVLARRQQLGLASEFSRLSEQRAALQNRSEMAVAQGAQALAYVALYKALGGAPLPAELQAAEPPAEGRQP